MRRWSSAPGARSADHSARSAGAFRVFYFSKKCFIRFCSMATWTGEPQVKWKVYLVKLKVINLNASFCLKLKKTRVFRFFPGESHFDFASLTFEMLVEQQITRCLDDFFAAIFRFWRKRPGSENLNFPEIWKVKTFWQVDTISLIQRVTFTGWSSGRKHLDSAGIARWKFHFSFIEQENIDQEAIGSWREVTLTIWRRQWGVSLVFTCFRRLPVPLAGFPPLGAVFLLPTHFHVAEWVECERQLFHSYLLPAVDLCSWWTCEVNVLAHQCLTRSWFRLPSGPTFDDIPSTDLICRILDPFPLPTPALREFFSLFFLRYLLACCLE